MTLNSLTLGVRVSLSASWSKEGTFHRRDLFHAFTETREGQCALLASAACQITLIQSN